MFFTKNCALSFNNSSAAAPNNYLKNRGSPPGVPTSVAAIIALFLHHAIMSSSTSTGYSVGIDRQQISLHK